MTQNGWSKNEFENFNLFIIGSSNAKNMQSLCKNKKKREKKKEASS